VLAGGFTASMATRRLRTSFMASKMRNTSMPLTAALATKALTTSSL
jgi:hypothetical protein